MAVLGLLAAGLLAAGAAISAPAAQTPVHTGNPYAGAAGYRNPEWAAKAAAEPGGDRVADTPTAVWLDSIAGVAGDGGRMGLRAHLDAALAQGAGYAQFVLHNLPGRDCDRLFAEGAELGVADLARYRAEFIDPIATIMADPRYAGLRIVTVLEVRALPNLVVSTTPQPAATAACDTMRANGGYVAGIRYALNRLGAIPNVYTYLDAANHGRTGPAFEAVAQLLRDTVQGTPGVDGFVTNATDYAPLREPFVPVDDETRTSRWIAGNPWNEELPFALALRARLIELGFPSGTGMLIDTSRNGWGGPGRPSGPSIDPDVDIRVDSSRVDRRAHKANWCNQAGAGLGERPRADPWQGIDAYVWVQPPGVSDGSAGPSPIKGFNPMCDPTYPGNTANGMNPSTALPGAPDRGEWFPAQFRQLLANADPPLT